LRKLAGQGQALRQAQLFLRALGLGSSLDNLELGGSTLDNQKQGSEQNCRSQDMAALHGKVLSVL
ncbi:MAG TPA: hypothetical protein VNY75_06720, partial [Rhizomicrobium sp.]|nr:hypothetical protein [Rhizomicrobium sp.]